MRVRRIVEASVCALVGVVASTGIAWVCAVSQNDRMGFRLVCGPKRTSDDEPRLLDSPSIERFLALAIHSPSLRETARQASAVECTQASGFGVRVQELSCSVDDGGEDPAIVLGEAIEAGWPWSSLIAVRAQQPGFQPVPVGSTGWLEILPAREGGSFGEPGLFSLRNGLVLPIHPLVVGSILNATLYGTMLAAALAGSRTARSRWRRLRGRCEGCGYQIAGARDIRCPECGKA
jgi:hypothetical protein